MAHYTIVLGYVVPIPVGHRVQLEFRKKRTSLLSDEWTRDPREPTILDLDTGIEYYPLVEYRPPDESSFYARVLACRIGSDVGADGISAKTTLVLDPMEPPAGPYRSR